jgi:hypothetical protein
MTTPAVTYFPQRDEKLPGECGNHRDIFSPPSGKREVTSQVKRLSSNEIKIAPRLVLMAVGSSS